MCVADRKPIKKELNWQSCITLICLVTEIKSPGYHLFWILLLLLSPGMVVLIWVCDTWLDFVPTLPSVRNSGAGCPGEATATLRLSLNCFSRSPQWFENVHVSKQMLRGSQGGRSGYDLGSFPLSSSLRQKQAALVSCTQVHAPFTCWRRKKSKGGTANLGLTRGQHGVFPGSTRLIPGPARWTKG